MPAVIRSIKQHDGTLVYPETIVSAVHMMDGKRTLEAAVEELIDDSSVTEFNSDGSITQTMTKSGMIKTTQFLSNGSIVETCDYSDHTNYYTKTTTFNNDGSITVDVVFADNAGGGA